MSRAEFEEWMRKHEPSIPLDYGKDGPWYDWQDAGSYFALAKAATEAERNRCVRISRQHRERIAHTRHCDGLGMGDSRAEQACREIAAAIRGESDV